MTLFRNWWAKQKARYLANKASYYKHGGDW